MFDSSVWNSHLNEEATVDILSVQGWLKKVERGDARLLVPSIVITELAAHPDRLKLDAFEKALMHTSIDQLDITPAIARLGGQLRRAVIDQKMKIKTADALIVVAGDYYNADYILSFDPGILRCDGKFGIRAKIGPPSCGHGEPLLDIR